MVLEVVQQAWRLDATHRTPEHSLKPTFAVLQHDGGHGQLDVPEPLLPGGVVTCSTQSSSSCNDFKTDTIPQAEGVLGLVLNPSQDGQVAELVEAPHHITGLLSRQMGQQV